ncbi:MFS transporter [Wenjunlia tyrosinilytica]|uniref:MFS transporter n=1 Tax=Wenjunlia tyrosinilytica TaxID=1544741 RepID=A0A918DZS0_9ACTN|nr:MFS transporter [Wenjunlia tyrosinilytica]GGO96260.1 MFS transporter [Wenjunlia tyrosinilytica]
MPSLNKIRPSLRRLRVALTVFFALDGFVFAGWVVRIPAIKRQVGASAGELGMALLGVSAGAVLTMVVTGWLCTRFGSHAVTVACGVLLSLSIALPPLTHSALALGLVLLVFGAAYGGMNVSINSAAVELVTALRRPVMPTFHAAFSLGGLLGAGLGALVAPYLTPTRHLLVLTAVGLATTAVSGAVMLRSRIAAVPGDESTAPAPRTGRAPLIVALFGLIALCTAYGEGALADWGALHIEQDLHTGPGAAAAGYAAFSLAMTAGRLSGTRLLERTGQTTALALGGLTAAAGMLVASLAPLTWLVIAGFAVTGLGLANIFPIAVARAGALAGPGGVATASTFGYSGMLLGPPAIGFLADQVGLPTALTTVALLAALAAAVAYAVRGTARQSAHGVPGAPRGIAQGGRTAGCGSGPRRP